MAYAELKTLGLLSCTSEKASYPCKVSEMYLRSNLFRKAISYAKKHYDLIAILSAKYGLLLLDEVIEPYNETLNDKGTQEIKAWSAKVFEQMKSKLDLKVISVIYFHAGEKYRKYLVPHIEAVHIKCEVPLEGFRIGEQLQWYDQQCR